MIQEYYKEPEQPPLFKDLPPDVISVDVEGKCGLWNHADKEPLELLGPAELGPENYDLFKTEHQTNLGNDLFSVLTGGQNLSVKEGIEQGFLAAQAMVARRPKGNPTDIDRKLSEVFSKQIPNSENGFDEVTKDWMSDPTLQAYNPAVVIGLLARLAAVGADGDAVLPNKNELNFAIGIVRTKNLKELASIINRFEQAAKTATNLVNNSMSAEPLPAAQPTNAVPRFTSGHVQINVGACVWHRGEIPEPTTLAGAYKRAQDNSLEIPSFLKTPKQPMKSKGQGPIRRFLTSIANCIPAIR